MKRTILITLSVLLAIAAGAQNLPALEQLKANPRKAYGNDFPYQQEPTQLTKAPKGYKPFYISHYARHGSRYYWTDQLYKDLDTLLTDAHRRHLLTKEGEAFHDKFMAAKAELLAGTSELTQLGWEQHQGIARTMYNRFPEVFKRGGNVLAVSSLVGRCVLSMSAFCQELVQCNPKIEIREQASRSTLDAVVPADGQNPNKRHYPKVKPRYEQHRDKFRYDGCIGPLTVLMGINGADRDPEDPYEVKNCYQNWETCKACNTQLVFYRSKKSPDDILVKCLLNGCEATLPVPTESYPYYRWADFSAFYTKRCAEANKKL